MNQKPGEKICTCEKFACRNNNEGLLAPPALLQPPLIEKLLLFPSSCLLLGVPPKVAQISTLTQG